MLKEEYKTINVREGDEDYIVENFAMFGYRLAGKQAVILRGDVMSKQFVIYTREGPITVDKPIASDMIHYVKITLVRTVGGRNYAFEKTWGDVYDSLRQDSAYLAIRAAEKRYDARPRWGRFFLYLLLIAIPAALLIALRGSNWYFDIDSATPVGAYGLIALCVIGVILMICEISMRIYCRAASNRAEKDRKKILAIEKDFIRQCRTSNGRPNVNFRKINKIERHYRSIDAKEGRL